MLSRVNTLSQCRPAPINQAANITALENASAPTRRLCVQTDWTAAENTPVKPKLIGTKTYTDFPLEEVLPYIDWNPFFQVHPSNNP